jgi:hypothetical protein
MQMNRRKHHKIQTRFEKKMKLKERLIDMTSSVNHISRRDAKDFIEWSLHLKGVSFISYCTYKKKYPNNLVKALRTVVEKLSEEEK